ncbi:hypothetical protein UlMin_027380 [Ulmus minor]
MVFLRWGKRFKPGKGGVRPNLDKALDSFLKGIALNLGNNLTTEREKDNNSQFKEDELLARAIQESLNMESPPRYDNGNTYQPIPVYYPMGYRICAGCQTEIGFGRYLNCLNEFWHPECFRYQACNLRITDYEFSTSGNFPYHKACYKENYHPKCDVCKLFKYCPFHEHDGTPWCCSCERMECLESAIMDTSECQPLFLDYKNFMKSHYHMPETRGLCACPRFGAQNQAMDMKTEPYKLTCRCEVTAILLTLGSTCCIEIHVNINVYIEIFYILNTTTLDIDMVQSYLSSVAYLLHRLSLCFSLEQTFSAFASPEDMLDLRSNNALLPLDLLLEYLYVTRQKHLYFSSSILTVLILSLIIGLLLAPYFPDSLDQG